MNLLKSKTTFKKTILFLGFISVVFCSYSQNSNDSTKRMINFKGALSITNNGFSIVPSFSLGKPATMAILSIGGKRFSFEPELRFALEGKPWSFIFWGRYKLFNQAKFSMNIGLHPALNFRTDTITSKGVTNEMIITRRFLAGEIYPNYHLSKTISVGMYYLHARGMDKGSTKQTDYIAFRSQFSNIPIIKKVFLRFSPQIFYLKTDDKEGFYVNSVLTLARRNFPLSISSILNKAIQTTIVSKDFDWNLSLVYTFDKKYMKQ